MIIKTCAPFTDCISKINNTQVDNAKDNDTVIPMLNLIEYSDNYSKTSGSLWQYYRDEAVLIDAGIIVDFTGNDTIVSFNFKEKITGQTGNDGTKDVKKMVPLKYLNIFWRTLKLPLLNCEINLILHWYVNCVIWSNSAENQATTFAITDTKLFFSSCNFINWW